MKKFLKRVELEKKRILLEEIPKQSATAIKRKEKFKALKLKRKLKKSGKFESLDEVSYLVMKVEGNIYSFLFVCILGGCRIWVKRRWLYSTF